MNVIRTQPGSHIKEKLMRSRTKILVSALVAGASFAAAIPASAQNYPQSRYEDRYDRDGRYNDRNDSRNDRDGRYDDRDDSRYDRNYEYRGNANAIAQQIQQLQNRVNRSDLRDRISEREAAGLRRAVYDLRTQFRSFNRNGLTQREARALQERIQWIRARLQHDRHDDNRRY